MRHTHLTIRKKLIILLTIIILGFIILASVSLRASSSGISALEDIYTKNVLPQQEIIHISNEFNAILYTMTYVISEFLPPIQGKDKLLESRKRLDTFFITAKADTFYQDPVLKKEINAIIKEYKQANTLLDQALLEYKNENLEELNFIAIDWESVHLKINKHFHTIENHTQSRIVNIKKETSDQLTQDRMLVMIISAITILLAFLIITIISKYIVSSIKVLGERANAFANDLNVSEGFQHQNCDEIGKIANSMNTLLSNIQMGINKAKENADTTTNMSQEITRFAQDLTAIASHQHDIVSHSTELTNTIQNDLSHSEELAVQTTQDVQEGYAALESMIEMLTVMISAILEANDNEI